MLQKIKSGDFDIYTNEVIHEDVFNELYNKEEIIKKFETKVIASTHHPFATFLSKDRHQTDIVEGDYILLRAIKSNNKFEFVTKILKWGKFSIPKIVIKTLDMVNHEKVLFEIIKENKKEEIAKQNFVDMAKIEEEIKIICRENNFITLFKEYTTPITLPRFIDISPELIELFFLIHGDGHYKTKLYFVNKNPGLHIFVRQQFEKSFRIPKSIWRARLLFNNSADQELAKIKWKQLLNLNEEQFYPSISKSTLKTSDSGNLRIVIDKLIVATVFRYMFNKLMSLNTKQSLHALNGLLYAEGGARKNKQGLHKITLSFSQQEKNMFKNILNKTGISDLAIIYENRMFVISSWKNLCGFFKLFFINNLVPFDKHSERCRNALDGFLNHSFTRTMYKYLKILKEKPDFTIKELIMITNHRPVSMLNTLRKKQYSEFIEIKGKGVNKNLLKISITNEGENFIKLIEQIKEVYNERCKYRKTKEKEENK